MKYDHTNFSIDIPKICNTKSACVISWHNFTETENDSKYYNFWLNSSKSVNIVSNTENQSWHFYKVYKFSWKILLFKLYYGEF